MEKTDRATGSPYSVTKLVAHPQVVQDLRAGGPSSLLTVHLMPQNLCNQSCAFCSYRMPDNKNSTSFDESAHIPWEHMVRLLDDFEALGVQGIEVTGGGEPLAYPHTDALWEELGRRPFATALVTNGTLLKDRAPLVTANLKWARVSIDCATRETYARMRRAPERHFDRAWEAVEQLRIHAPEDPEYRLGVGFVLSNENTEEVYDFVRMAKDHGAHNVRLSCTFSDLGDAYFKDPSAVARAAESAVRAKADFEDDGFAVANLLTTRSQQIRHPVQDYDACITKDVLCVVEGEGKVYTCCTFTGSAKGCQGNFMEYPGGFKALWESKAEWRKKLNPREYCKVVCLYRDRNRAMLAMMAGSMVEQPKEVLHKEFI